MGRASIRKTVAFASVTMALLFAIIASAIFASNQALRGLVFDLRHSTERTLAAEAELERILAARASAARFWRQRDSAHAEAAIDSLDAVISCEASCAFFEPGSKERTKLYAVIEDARAFREVFLSTLETDEALRALSLELTLTGTRARALLSDLMSDAHADGAAPLTTGAGFALEAFLLGQTYTERFLLAGDPLDLRSAEAEFAALRNRISELRALASEEIHVILVEAASRQFTAYFKHLPRAETLLAELAEGRAKKLDVLGPALTRGADALRDHVFNFLRVRGPAGLETIQRANTWTIGLALVAVFVGALASILFANRLSSAVVGMARRMRRVAEGDLAFEIDGADRRDELGEMARALSIFQQNARLAQDVEHLREQQSQLQTYAFALEEAKDEAESAALTDPLTGLANRRHLDLHLKAQVRAAKAEDRFAALHVDLDRFKQINDTLGHKAGDFVLTHVADTLRAITRSGDFIARVGGDEFVILCAPGSPEHVIEGIAKRIVRELAEPVAFEGNTCRFGASVGAASALASEAELLIEHADIALYQAKADGRGTVAHFTPALRARLVESKTVADEILIGLERGEFIPHFQPLFAADTQNLVGVEALARWRHPRRGLLEPARFLSAARDVGALDRIEAAMFEGAMAFCDRAWSRGLHIPRLSLNVSPSRLSSAALLEDARLAAAEATPIALELAESLCAEGESGAVSERIAALRALGVQIEIDDYGSASASVSSLIRIAPDRVKIDGALIAPMLERDEDRLMVETLVDMARGLSIGVVAEGVETEAHAALLIEAGCDTLQGFHFARPMDGEALISFLLEEGWRAGRTARIA